MNKVILPILQSLVILDYNFGIKEIANRKVIAYRLDYPDSKVVVESNRGCGNLIKLSIMNRLRRNVGFEYSSY